MSHLVGIQKFLAEFMWLMGVVLIVVTIAVTWVLRRLSAGRWYNVTYSGQIGDVALTVCVLLGLSVLRNLEAPLPWWAGAENLQIMWFLICYILSVVFLQISGEKPIGEEQLPEIWHAFVVVPGLLYLVTTTLFVTTWTEAYGVLTIELALIMFWIFLVYVDARTGRARQVRYHLRTRERFLFGW